MKFFVSLSVRADTVETLDASGSHIATLRECSNDRSDFQKTSGSDLPTRGFLDHSADHVSLDSDFSSSPRCDG